MAIVVEDGTGLADAVSYAAVTTADAYHTARGNSSWAGTDEAKEAALIRATEALDGKYANNWPGYRLTDTQALDWPRAGALDIDGYDLDDLPDAVVKATCEAALVEIGDAGALSASLERGGMVISKKTGPIEKTYANGAPAGTVYPAIARHLARIVGSGAMIKMTPARGA